ncbi:MAG: AAA family ATPase [Flavobacteriaceae bacterium]|nr:AAA family ATPase [Flavobacteriaceae bacterium]
MKITESKFYRPAITIGLDDEYNIEIVDRNKILPKNNYYKLLKDSFFCVSFEREAGIVMQKEKLKNFVKCTDFYNVRHSAKKNKLYEEEICYFHQELEIFIILNADISDNYNEEKFDEGVYMLDYIFYDATNPNAQKNVNYLFDTYFEKYVSKEAKISVLMYQNNHFSLKTHTIKPHRIDLDLMYNDDFKEVHSKIKQSISEENKGIVLLHGISGAGKTNYIKWLTSQIPDKKFIFVPTTMIASLTDPNFIGLLIDSPNSVLVMEDCENYIAERNTLNSNTDVVSSILNIADGILSDVVECQLICTFNSDISKIDTALLREGRLIAEYKFRELSVEKSNAYLKAMNIDNIVEKPVSLAQLTHLNDKIFREEEQKKIGF